ncbi:DUF4262 domain-containing protein [Pedobacter sp.]|uniref:DUF4262 domain-containing protein n=1 Tax=Pedobacter sp. TaxID=1411316 RepID=UPI003BAB3B5E
MEKDRIRAYFEIVDNNIKKNGFHVTYVQEEKDFTPFGYSTGLYKNFGIPEAFVSGLPNGLTNNLIHKYAETFKAQEIPLNKRLNNLMDDFPVYIIPVENKNLSKKILSSFKWYEDDVFKSIQIIFPDLAGKFPQETGYDYDQEIMGHLFV